MTADTPRLLAADEPAPVRVTRPGGTSAFFLTCDHGGRRFPRALGDLGVSEAEQARHIGWDIGAAAVAQMMSAALDATLIEQIYSRLVIDCNRTPSVPSSIPEISETTEIPGNRALSPAARQARIDEIFAPYHDRTRALLDARAAAGRPTVLIAVHSFTPVYKGVARPWDIGILYNRDDRVARPLIAVLGAEGDLTVGDNEPYHVGDQTDYGIPVHGERRGLLHVELEIRQDQIADPAGQQAWADRLVRLLPAAMARLGG
ncbi:N-formylglutamate amidohydrolase [Acidimangrovimonas sediminis]|uniref:N-formylglutamate amidohydrolase n=1 Tax=Acidimangrovimonas sediminis TaxID=2056283 RepID=UPI000C7FC1EA|nr:N-formylglutamate amidohydrolase [Acidimangrovimonas sediminis]